MGSVYAELFVAAGHEVWTIEMSAARSIAMSLQESPAAITW